ncbi:MAG: ABC transporter ATP-binding protein [Gammaproteobacteria bacterium]
MSSASQRLQREHREQEGPLLTVRDLAVRFYTMRGIVHALTGVSFDVGRRESVGLVGETGCGKSITARAVLRLIEPPGHVDAGSIQFDGANLLDLSELQMREIRGERISMIMQEPKVSLNPVMRVGRQIAETLLIHHPELKRREARERALDMLRSVRIPDAGRMARRFPHELSGGMAQRIMIAMMLVTRPRLLVADEPTSALDVTIQAQILELINGLIDEIHSSVLMITHDLAVVAETCDRVLVMYAGTVVESGTVSEVLGDPKHPYTRGLLQTLPERAAPGSPLRAIKGNVPSLFDPPEGCRFAPRCEHAMAHCFENRPPEAVFGDPSINSHRTACFLYADGNDGPPRAKPDEARAT